MKIDNFTPLYRVLPDLFALILTVFTLGGCCGLERTDFEQFLIWEGVVVLKELILNSF